MKKFTYYFINNKGEKQLARKQTNNEYYYGEILTNNLTQEQSCVKCSCKREIIQNDINYQLKYYSKEYNEKYSKSIVELIQQINIEES